MAGFLCPYCGMVMAIDASTFSKKYPSFANPDGRYIVPAEESSLEISFYHCPNCKEYTIMLEGYGNKVLDTKMMVRPYSLAKKYPEYIPKAIRADYEEACAILQLSPKSSATLARRCLQGMIHDYWNIKKNTLNQEIIALKDMLQPDLWKAIDGLRQIGNIGAHMEKDINLIIDIDEGEAEKLIKLIELLMKEWYINREERKLLFEDILLTNENKQSQRKGEE